MAAAAVEVAEGGDRACVELALLVELGGFALVAARPREVVRLDPVAYVDVEHLWLEGGRGLRDGRRRRGERRQAAEVLPFGLCLLVHAHGAAWQAGDHHDALVERLDILAPHDLAVELANDVGSAVDADELAFGRSICFAAALLIADRLVVEDCDVAAEDERCWAACQVERLSGHQVVARLR